MIELHICVVCCAPLSEAWSVCGPRCYMALVELQLNTPLERPAPAPILEMEAA